MRWPVLASQTWAVLSGPSAVTIHLPSGLKIAELDDIPMLKRGRYRLAGLDVPDAGGFIGGSRYDPSVIRAEIDSQYRSLMLKDRLERGIIRQIPKGHGKRKIVAGAAASSFGKVRQGIRNVALPDQSIGLENIGLSQGILRGALVQRRIERGHSGRRSFRERPARLRSRRPGRGTLKPTRKPLRMRTRRRSAFSHLRPRGNDVGDLVLFERGGVAREQAFGLGQRKSGGEKVIVVALVLAPKLDRLGQTPALAQVVAIAFDPAHRAVPQFQERFVGKGHRGLSGMLPVTGEKSRLDERIHQLPRSPKAGRGPPSRATRRVGTSSSPFPLGG